MEKDDTVSGTDVSTPHLEEDTMGLMMEPLPVQLLSHPILTNPCTHSRAIDDALTRGKKRTGKVRCLECGVIFDDPYQGSK